jgi:hypothetical protein
MTVGIALTNGLEAIVITDSRVSGSGRESDSIKKMGEFSSKNYHGVIFGTGRVDSILGIIKNLGSVSEDNLDKYVLALHTLYKNNMDSEEKIYFASIKDEINRKSSLIENPEEREHYVRRETTRVIENYDKSKREEGFLAIVAYDKEKGKIRQFTFGSSSVHEQFNDHMEIGSGSDGANLYISNKLQGVDTSKLKTTDLAFFALNAYSSSTLNQGVGGTPIIAMVSARGCDVLPPEKINTLGNISGAYLSEYPSAELDLNSTRRVFHLVMDLNKVVNYGNLAEKIGLNEETLTKMYIPYKSWQETANRMLFNETKE